MYLPFSVGFLGRHVSSSGSCFVARSECLGVNDDDDELSQNVPF